MRKISFQAHITDKQYEVIESVSAAAETSMSEVIRAVLKQAIDENKIPGIIASAKMEHLRKEQKRVEEYAERIMAQVKEIEEICAYDDNEIEVVREFNKEACI